MNESFVWFQRGVDFINYIDDVSLCSVKSKCPVSSPRTMPQQVDLRRGLDMRPTQHWLDDVFFSVGRPFSNALPSVIPLFIEPGNVHLDQLNSG